MSIENNFPNPNELEQLNAEKKAVSAENRAHLKRLRDSYFELYPKELNFDELDELVADISNEEIDYSQMPQISSELYEELGIDDPSLEQVDYNSLSDEEISKRIVFFEKEIKELREDIAQKKKKIDDSNAQTQELLEQLKTGEITIKESTPEEEEEIYKFFEALAEVENNPSNRNMENEDRLVAAEELVKVRKEIDGLTRGN